MNGIVQWQDSNTNYPLINAGNLRGLFCDASFVMFDNFIPILNTITIDGTNLEFTFTFDNGSNTFTIAISSAIPNTVFKLKDTSRVYGNVVFGPLINDVISNSFGSSIKANLSFESVTVRTINSSNGIYSINGINNNVNITLDDNFWFSSNKFNAASVPDNLQYITTNATDLYLVGDSNQLLDGSSASTIATLDRNYSAIINIGSNFIGASTDGSTTDLYLISQLPAIYLSTIDYPITALAYDSSLHLWGISESSLLDLGVSPFIVTPVVYAIGLTPSGLTFINNKLVICVDGDPDYANPSTYFSSNLYSLTPSGSSTTNNLIGTMATTSSNHLSWLNGLTSLNGKIYGLVFTNPGYIIYEIDPVSLLSTEVVVYSVPATKLVAQALFYGGNTITINTISPLKSINLLGPIDNNLYINGSSFITVTQQSNDTLAFSLPIKDQNLNVTRTTQYA